MAYQHKTISVSEKHAAFVKEESINLSRLVRKFLDQKLIEKNGGLQSYKGVKASRFNHSSKRDYDKE